MSFEKHLRESVHDGHVNLVFEYGQFLMKEDLQRLLELFKAAGVPFELIGGIAVNVYLMQKEQRSRSFVTRDVDLLVRRSDLEAIVGAAKSMGMEAKKIMVGYALLRPEQSLSEAFHLMFVGERPRSSCAVPNPELRPEMHPFLGLVLPVAPIQDLITLKLNSLRPNDVVHLDILDEVGFIDSEFENTLPDALRQQLQIARLQFERETAEE